MLLFVALAIAVLMTPELEWMLTMMDSHGVIYLMRGTEQ